MKTRKKIRLYFDLVSIIEKVHQNYGNFVLGASYSYGIYHHNIDTQNVTNLVIIIPLHFNKVDARFFNVFLAKEKMTEPLSK